MAGGSRRGVLWMAHSVSSFADKWYRSAWSLWISEAVSYTHLDVYKRQEQYVPSDAKDCEAVFVSFSDLMARPSPWPTWSSNYRNQPSLSPTTKPSPPSSTASLRSSSRRTRWSILFPTMKWISNHYWLVLFSAIYIIFCGLYGMYGRNNTRWTGDLIRK